MSDRELLRLIGEGARVGLAVVDADRRYVYTNPTYSEILGLPTISLVGRRVADLLPDVYEQQIRSRLDRGFAGERLGYELRKSMDSGDRYFAVSYEPAITDDVVTGVVVVITDVTARKASEADATLCAAIVECSDDAIIGKDLDGIVTSWNPGAERIFGYTAPEMIGSPITRLIPENRRDEEARILASIRRGDRVRHFETVRRRKDGRTIEVSVTTSPIKDAEGQVIGASKVARDITERKHGEEALRRERDRAQRYLDTADVMLLALDADGFITLINRKGCDLLGWTEAELLGRSWSETCLPARLRHSLKERFDELLAGDLSVVENPVLTRNGEERLIEWRNRLLHDEDGNVTGSFSSGADITDRHEAVEALRVAEERMRFALQNAGVGIWDMDYVTGTARMSEILESHYGLAPGSFGGTYQAFLDLVHPADREQMVATVEQAMRSGRDFSTEHRALLPDGSVRWLSSSGRIQLDERGRAVRGVGISLDITDRRSLEAQYHQSQKMEAVGRLAGGIAHDFNNMLTAILGFSQLLFDTFGPNDPRRADIEEIQKAGESAAGLTRQLLAFSRKQIIEPTVLDLNEVVGKMQGLLGRLIGDDVHVVFKLRPGLSRITADPGQIEQIVLNLAVNARDAMPNGGTLTIETAEVELDAHYAASHHAVEPGAYVTLTVSDTGVGMSPEIQSRLFEPFFTTKPLGKGTGLGLATVHGIVTGSSGRIGVYSEPDKGTSVVAYLPRSAGEVSVTPASVPTPRIRSGERVLVVDDSTAVRELARRMLELDGYQVAVAANASEAMKAFEVAGIVDVLLTDVVMPDGSGPDLAARLSGLHPGLKVIYMSGYTEDTITHHGIVDAGIAFLQKPFSSASLERKLRDLLDA